MQSSRSHDEFYWKGTEKRFTELSRETEVLNMVTEIMGLYNYYVKPNSEADKAMYWGSSLLSVHSRRNVYVYSISAILCSGVTRNIRQPRQPAPGNESLAY